MAKKLLEEATVRRFMKIAGLQPLSEGFVDTLEEKKDEEEKLEEEETVEEAKEEKGKDKEKLKEEDDAAEESKDGKMEESIEMEEGYGMSEEDPTPADDAPAAPMDDEPEEDDAELESALEKVLSALGYEVSLDDEDKEEEMPMGDDEPEALDESEHMEEPPADPAGTSLESLPMVDDADSKDPNQDPKQTEEEPMKEGGEHMGESKELKDKLVEQVAKRVAARLKKMK